MITVIIYNKYSINACAINDYTTKSWARMNGST